MLNPKPAISCFCGPGNGVTLSPAAPECGTWGFGGWECGTRGNLGLGVWDTRESWVGSVGHEGIWEVGSVGDEEIWGFGNVGYEGIWGWECWRRRNLGGWEYETRGNLEVREYWKRRNLGAERLGVWKTREYGRLGVRHTRKFGGLIFGSEGDEGILESRL